MMKFEPNKTFPIQADRWLWGDTDKRQRVSGGIDFLIPWEVAEIAWKEYDETFHCGQSCLRIAERGGFGESEMDMFYPEWRNHVLRLDPNNTQVLDALKYGPQYINNVNPYKRK
jgi:hypothetical protein